MNESRVGRAVLTGIALACGAIVGVVIIRTLVWLIDDVRWWLVVLVFGVVGVVLQLAYDRTTD
jgi:undecaprenyl pyrophosphate phosphatase UppP